jgi:bis(5'-nucleosidyl)-tetraphosphatase
MYRKSVFVVVYRLRNNKPQYLLLKRKRNWKGWEFVKGGVEKEESEIFAAKREVLEETGNNSLKIINHNYRGQYRFSKSFLKGGIFGQQFSLYSSFVRGESVVIDGREHSGYNWFSFSEAVRLLRWKNQKKSLILVNGFVLKEINKLKIIPCLTDNFKKCSQIIYLCIEKAKKLSVNEKKVS